MYRECLRGNTDLIRDFRLQFGRRQRAPTASQWLRPPQLRPVGRFSAVFAPALFSIILGLNLASSASASVFTVNSTMDAVDARPGDGVCETEPGNGVCTLRAAIQETNALGGTNTIILPAGTYLLTIPGKGEDFAATGDLDIRSNLTITGSGSSTTIIDGNSLDRVFHVDPAAVGLQVTISGVTIQNGANPFVPFVGGFGAGILNRGILKVVNCVVQANVNNDLGGGISNGGIVPLKSATLVLIHSTVVGNSSTVDGGGIYNSPGSSLSATDSTISNNRAGAAGGGIFSDSGFPPPTNPAKVALTNATLNANTATLFGGGIAVTSGTLTLTNATVTGNAVSFNGNGEGGGIYFGGSLGAINNSTITSNTVGPLLNGVGGGINNAASSLTLTNTIVSGNGGQQDCYGTLTSGGYNLIQNVPPAGCAVGGNLTGNITGQDPKLGPLADNGGPAQTQALLSGSPAINAGSPAGPGSGGTACAITDERGVSRPQGGQCDIGAFERQGGLSLSGITPSSAGNVGPVVTLISGSGFLKGAAVKLTRNGAPDIVGSSVTVAESNAVLSAAFDLTGIPPGFWNLVVTNPNGTSVIQSGAFSIEQTRAPLVWGNVFARQFIRVGQPATFTFIYGNGGNVDAQGVPLMLKVPNNVTLNLTVPITPPPAQPGQIPTNWGQVPINLVTDPTNAETTIALFLPVIPAGYTGALDFTLTAQSDGSGQSLLLQDGFDEVYFQPALDPQVVNALLAGAEQYAQRVIGVTIPAALVPTMQQYLINGLQSAVQNGRKALVTSLGQQSQVYSLSQIVADVAQFAAAQVH